MSGHDWRVGRMLPRYQGALVDAAALALVAGFVALAWGVAFIALV